MTGTVHARIATFGCAAALSLLATTGSGSPRARGLPHGIVPVPRPLAGVFANACTSQTGATPHLAYLGGPVLQNVKVYAVFWTTAVDPNVAQKIGQFYGDVLASDYFDLLQEYATVGVTPTSGSGTNQGLSRGQFEKAFTITPMTTTCTGTPACTLTNDAIAAELKAQIAAGHLPAPTTGCDGQTDTLYMIDFPSGITITLTVGGQTITSCQQFCGYHEYTTIGAQVVPYGVLPDMVNGPCAQTCSTKPPATFDDSTSVHSHELFEAVTDTAATIDASDQYAAPSAWTDANCGEIGDICNFQEATITVNGHTWTVQQEWSNAAGDCVTAPAAIAPVCTGANTPAGCRACTCSDATFTGSGAQAAYGCDGATPACATTSSDVDVGRCVQCTRDADCGAGRICRSSSDPTQDDTCVACGAVGQPCCSGGTCTSTGATCSTGDAGGVGDGGGAAGEAGTGTDAGPSAVRGTCTCTPKTCASLGYTCGSADDGCGGTLDCGACEGDQVCEANACVAAPSDAGSGSGDGGGAFGDTGTGPGSCACDAVGAPSGTTASALALGPLAWLGMAARRRRRARRAEELR